MIDKIIKTIKNLPMPALVVAGVLLGTIFGALLFTNDDNTQTGTFDSSASSSGTLAVPPLLDYTTEDGVKNFSLTAQDGSYEFVDGVASSTSGFNGDILGPTIRASEGDEVNFAVTNKLDEQTTSHWHGAVVPGHADGGVHNIIKPDETWNARFKVRQEAATLWYHPHQHEETARQV